MTHCDNSSELFFKDFDDTFRTTLFVVEPLIAVLK